MGRLEFLYKSDLPHRAIAVYQYLYDRAGKDSRCFPSVPTIARHTKLSVSTVHRAIQDLKNEGFLSVIPRQRKNGSASSNLYYLYHPPP